MKWTVIAPGDHPSDVAAICAGAGAGGPEDVRDGVAQTLDRVATDGVVVLGADSDLARVAHAVNAVGRHLPLAFIPNRSSDVLPMFGHRRSDMIGRLSGGVAYPADLGIATHADGSVPFIAHSVASRHGGLKRTGRQSAEVHIELARRSYAIDAWAVVAANTQHLGPYTIAPKAAVTDGELDLQGLGGRRRRLLRTARRGLHLTSAASWRRSTRSAVIDVPAKWVIAADGIPVARGPFEVSVIEHAFDLWI